MQISDIVVFAFYVYALLVIVALIAEERDPSTTLAWVITLIVLPVAGVILFLFLGRDLNVTSKTDRLLREASDRAQRAMAPHYERWSARGAATLSVMPGLVSRMAHLIERQNKTRPLPATDLEIFTAGEVKFARLLEDIEAATDFIHLQYFIWEHDALTDRLCTALAKKAAEGVEVRVMYDWVGSLPYKKDELQRIDAAGGQTHADAAHWSRLNYRNHRKIAIIDGRIGYTGGMNVGQEYIDGQPHYASWRDTHARFGGPLVAELQRLFAERWYRGVKEDLFSERYLPETGIEGASRVSWGQVCYSGPESPRQELRNAILVAIASAEHKVRIQSPYFVPDDPVLEAMVTQSLAGVDMGFMMTGVADKKLAWNAAFSYLDELTEAGGKAYQYDAGFFHPKCMSIDGVMGVIGTTNFDIRSFLLHDELSVFFYDDGVAAELEQIFDEDAKHCHVLDHSSFESLGRWGRFRNAMARLTSRVL